MDNQDKDTEIYVLQKENWFYFFPTKIISLFNMRSINSFVVTLVRIYVTMHL